MSKASRKQNPDARSVATKKSPGASVKPDEPQAAQAKSATTAKLSGVAAVPAASEAAGKQAAEPLADTVNDGIDQFDEAYYTGRYQDVASSIAAGVWHNGLMHYAISGRASARSAAPKVDEAWYEKAYPLAAREVAAGRAKSLADHYHRIGRYRGYIPTFKGQRADDSAGSRSQYGGLWTDQGNAMDLIEGRRDLGRLTAEEAQLLRRWVLDGYVIIPNAVPEELLTPALDDLNRAYEGQLPELRFDIHGLGRLVAWDKVSQTAPSKALDIHWYSPAVRNLVLAPALVSFLHLIFERRVLASQTLGFWRGSQQNGHQDSAYVNYSLPLQFAASWIALEDVKEGAGELFYHVGSHRIGEYHFHRRFKGVSEARRLGFSEPHTEAQIAQHVSRIADQAKGLGLRTEKFLAKRGDALFWSADLVHGGSPISKVQTRKSVVTHYCPVECAPAFFERGKSKIRSHGQEFYASGYYRD